MNTFIPTKEALNDAVSNAVKEELEKVLPEIIRKASRKEWMNTKELQEFTGWSPRTILYLRKKRRIPFSQEGRRILYRTSDIEAYLEEIGVKPQDID